MASRQQKFARQQQALLEEVKRAAKSVGKSIAELAPWTPFEEAEPIPELPEDRIFINSRYQVNIKAGEAPPPFGFLLELSIKTRDKAPFHDWRDFQRIKNELIGERFEALELYPSEKRLVDTANQYYMFVFPELNFKNNWFPFGFRDRLVAEGGIGGSQQRPFEVRPPDLETAETFRARIEAELKRRKDEANGGPAIPNRDPDEMARQSHGGRKEDA